LSLLVFEYIAPRYKEALALKETSQINYFFDKLKDYVTRINVLKNLDLVGTRDEDKEISFIRQSVLFTKIYDESNTAYEDQNYITVAATVMSLTGEVFPMKFHLNYWAHLDHEDIFAGGDEDTIRMEFGDDYGLHCYLLHPDSWDEDDEYSELLRWVKSVAALLRLSSQSLEKLNTLWAMLISILVPNHLRNRFEHFRMTFDRDPIRKDITYEELEEKRVMASIHRRSWNKHMGRNVRGLI